MFLKQRMPASLYALKRLHPAVETDVFKSLHLRMLPDFSICVLLLAIGSTLENFKHFDDLVLCFSTVG